MRRRKWYRFFTNVVYIYPTCRNTETTIISFCNSKWVPYESRGKLLFFDVDTFNHLLTFVRQMQLNLYNISTPEYWT